MTVTNPNWSTNPNDLRVRHDVPNATNTEAGKTIVKNDRLVGALSGAGQGLAAGAGVGALTGLGLSEFTDISDPASIAIGTSVGLGGALLGGLTGGFFAHKKAKTDLAEAELGIKRTPQNTASNQSLYGGLTDALILNQLLT